MPTGTHRYSFVISIDSTLHQIVYKFTVNKKNVREIYRSPPEYVRYHIC